MKGTYSPKVGDWVTQYSKGYWKIIGVLPKYADMDYDNEPYHYRFGDQIGTWVLMKKGFTPKMKFRLDSDFCDGYWCKPVSSTEQDQIDEYFHSHPADLERFQRYEFVEHPMISSLWMNLTDNQEKELNEVINSLPARFTMESFMNEIKRRNLGHIICNPPASHIMNLFSLPWELDEQKRLLYKDPMIHKTS